MGTFEGQGPILSIRHKNSGYVFNLSGKYSQVESFLEISNDVFTAALFVKQALSGVYPNFDEAIKLNEVQNFFKFADERFPIPFYLQGISYPGSVVRSYGAYIYEKMLPTDIKSALESLPESSSLILDLDERSAAIPWELASNGRNFLHLKFSCGRKPLASEVHVSSKAFGQWRLLIVANPTGDLPETLNEANYIISQLRDLQKLRIARFGYEITKKHFLDLIRNGEYHIIHYTGHSAEYTDSEKSHLLFRDGPCYASDIQAVLSENSPLMVFANSCLSAHQLQSGTTSLADSFLNAGVTSYVGALWPVSDQGSAMVASDFYRLVLHGNTIGEALRKARLTSFGKWGYHDHVWSSFILFGDPQSRLFINND